MANQRAAGGKTGNAAVLLRGPDSEGLEGTSATVPDHSRQSSALCLWLMGLAFVGASRASVQHPP